MTGDARPGGADDELVELLARLHARNGGAAAPAEREGLYAEAIRHFAGHEASLRAQSRMAESIVRRIRGVQEDVLQRVLPLRAPAGGVAGGRFLLANELGRDAVFGFSARFGCPCAFGPDPARLAAGAVTAVDVRVDLAGAPFAAGESVTLLVDVVEGGRTRLKLWLDICLDAA